MIGNRGTSESPATRTAYAALVRPPVPLLRFAYRAAHVAMRGYWFVRRPKVDGVKCVLTDGAQVLLVRHTYGDREWDLPGGSVRRGELPVNAARREMKEELGLTIEDWSSLGRMLARMHHRRDTLHCFQAELDDPSITMHPGELAAVKWFSRRQLPHDLGVNVRRILARAQG
jgi:8-oxo-dGTP pyrophosphatase MutT (NUDIX family)